MTNYNERLDEVIKGAVTPAWLQQTHETTDVPAYQLHLHTLIKELGLSTNQKIEVADLMRNADNHDTLNEQIERANRWAREQDDTK